MLLLNSLKRISFFVCILAAFQCAVPVMQAMDKKENTDEANDNKSPLTRRKNNIVFHGSSGTISQEDSPQIEKEGDLPQEINSKPLSEGKIEIKKEIEIIYNPTTPGITSISHQTTGMVNSKSPPSPPLEERRKSISGPLEGILSSNTPTKEENKIPKVIPSSAPPYPNKIEKSLSRGNKLQWVGNRNFKINLYSKNEVLKHTYLPLKTHENLREMVDKNLPKKGNIFALQLTVLIQPQEGKKGERTLIKFPLKEKEGEGKNILFVSRSKTNQYSESYVFFNGDEIDEEKKKNWFSLIYPELKEKNTSALTYHHSEQWAMLWFFDNLSSVWKQFCEKNQPSKIYGVFLDGHTLRDPCSKCQPMFEKKVPDLFDAFETESKKNSIKLSKRFFVLPILSSQNFYDGSSRLNPYYSLKSIEVTVSSSKLDAELYKGLQNTAQYKTQFSLAYNEKKEDYDLRKDFEGRFLFPCIWLYEDEKVLENLNEKIFRLLPFQKATGEGSPYSFSLNFTYTAEKTKKQKTEKVFNKNSYFYKPDTLRQELSLATSLTSLTLTSQKWGDDGFREFALALPYLTALTSLDLQRNKLELINLELKEEKISEPQKQLFSGFQSLLQSFSSLKSLKILNLSNNIFEEESAKILSQTLLHLNNLENLILQNSQIDYQSANHILDPVHLMPCIDLVDLSNNRIFDGFEFPTEVENKSYLLFQKAVKIKREFNKFTTTLIKINLDNNFKIKINSKNEKK